MKTLAVVCCSLVLGVALSYGIHTAAEAEGYDSRAAELEAVGAADPVASTSEGDLAAIGSKVYSLWRDGAIAPAILLAAFGLALLLKRYVAWFSKGQAAFIFGAVMLTLSTLGAPILMGETPTAGMIVGAIGAGVALYLNSRGQAEAGPKLKAVP